jgi:hypothetical protein
MVLRCADAWGENPFQLITTVGEGYYTKSPFELLVWKLAEGSTRENMKRETLLDAVGFNTLAEAERAESDFWDVAEVCPYYGEPRGPAILRDPRCTSEIPCIYQVLKGGRIECRYRGTTGKTCAVPYARFESWFESVQPRPSIFCIIKNLGRCRDK